MSVPHWAASRLGSDVNSARLAGYLETITYRSTVIEHRTEVFRNQSQENPKTPVTPYSIGWDLTKLADRLRMRNFAQNRRSSCAAFVPPDKQDPFLQTMSLYLAGQGPNSPQWSSQVNWLPFELSYGLTHRLTIGYSSRSLEATRPIDWVGQMLM